MITDERIKQIKELFLNLGFTEQEHLWGDFQFRIHIEKYEKKELLIVSYSKNNNTPGRMVFNQTKLVMVN
jgi:hypothetical protein